MSTVKIFVCHSAGHNSVMPNSSCYVHVHGGAALDKEHLHNMVRDDTGGNISLKNRNYCELTVQYWAWKNVEADYYGFCHYRRYFSFNPPEGQIADHAGTVVFNAFDEEIFSQLNVAEDTIIDLMEKSSLALCPPVSVKTEGVKNVYEQYRKNHIINDLDVLMAVIHDLSPEFETDAKEYVNGDKLYLANMFIMSKSLFFRYCTWMFKLLAECEHRIDISKYSETHARIFGFLSERLLGIFYLHLQRTENIQAKLFQRIFILDAEKEEEIEPAFHENNIPIVLISSEEYAPITGVFITSVLEQASPKSNYDFIILHQGVSKKNQIVLRSLVELVKEKGINVSIRLFDMAHRKRTASFRIAESRFNMLVYDRLFAPWILKNYTKALVLDSDIIVRADIAELFHEDISDYLAAAVNDTVYQGVLNINDNDVYGYTKNIMGMNEPYDYVNAGVKLLNLEKIRNEYSEDYVNRFIQDHVFRIDEQDAFNALFSNNIKFLDICWNYFIKTNWWVDAMIQNAPAKSKALYQSCENPLLLHWANWNKPWLEPDMEYAHEFWEVARKTPFYEILLNRLAMQRAAEKLGAANSVIVDTVNQMMNEISLKKLLMRAVKNRLKRFVDFSLPEGSLCRNIVKKLYYRLWKRAPAFNPEVQHLAQ